MFTGCCLRGEGSHKKVENVMVEFVHTYLVEEAQVNHEKLFFFFYSISISIIDIFSKLRILYAVAVLY